jgi:hypothetical protein
MTPAQPRSTRTATSSSQAGSIRRTARWAGALYLTIFVVAPFAFLVARSTILVEDDPAATAQNLIDNEGRFRLGLAAESVVFLVEIVLAALLYVIFRPVSRTISLAAAFSRVAEAVVQAANLLPAALALLAVGGAGYLAAFSQEQRDDLVLLALDANEFMILVWGLFFALHLLLLGYLVYRSGFFPRVLGVLLALASVGYFAESYGTILSPGASDVLGILVVVLAVPGELAFAFWLLVKGVDDERWNERALEAERPSASARGSDGRAAAARPPAARTPG